MKLTTLALLAFAGYVYYQYEQQQQNAANVSTGNGYGDQTSSSSITSLENDVLPRGIRNNNPGNIRYNAANNWQGQTGQDADGFAIFDTMEDGIRALALLLQNYYTNDNLNTVSTIINYYAPSSDNNNVSAYVTAVATSMNVDPNAPLDLTNQTTNAAMCSAIITHENGVGYADIAQITATVDQYIG